MGVALQTKRDKGNKNLQLLLFNLFFWTQGQNNCIIVDKQKLTNTSLSVVLNLLWHRGQDSYKRTFLQTSGEKKSPVKFFKIIIIIYAQVGLSENPHLFLKICH